MDLVDALARLHMLQGQGVSLESKSSEKQSTSPKPESESTKEWKTLMPHTESASPNPESESSKIESTSCCLLSEILKEIGYFANKY